MAPSSPAPRASLDRDARAASSPSAHSLTRRSPPSRSPPGIQRGQRLADLYLEMDSNESVLSIIRGLHSLICCHMLKIMKKKKKFELKVMTKGMLTLLDPMALIFRRAVVHSRAL